MCLKIECWLTWDHGEWCHGHGDVSLHEKHPKSMQTLINGWCLLIIEQVVQGAICGQLNDKIGIIITFRGYSKQSDDIGVFRKGTPSKDLFGRSSLVFWLPPFCLLSSFKCPQTLHQILLYPALFQFVYQMSTVSTCTCMDMCNIINLWSLE